MPSVEELNQIARELDQKFEKDKDTAIKLIGTSIIDHPELIKILGNDSYENMVQKGLVSLRPGFYKVIDSPFYKDYGNGIDTFGAKVLYLENFSDRSIEYSANVGPLTNINLKYFKLGGNGEQDRLLHEFLDDRARDSRDRNYFNSKFKFFNSLYQQNKLFWVKSSEFSKQSPGSKEIVWTFFN